MRTRVFGALGCLLLVVGCGEPPPDTTPGVRILSPVTNQVLPPYRAIEVTFAISGIDPDSPPDASGKRPPFRLEPSQIKRPGYGRVVAYLNGTTIQAVSAKETEPITVPSPPYGNDPKDIVLPGPARISLFLQYNDGTPVTPQRPGEVTVSIAAQ
ncbi:MAG: hypothetical protein RMK29_15250 [Myxococcales bacterium]|nr:hypothetical protein [Myxococcota bacterium]MDW8283072.1 hypothetical protein [Myxococcales bacterium]